MASIKIHDRFFDFEIIRRQRKTVEIQIDSETGFRVIVPKRLSEKALMTLLEPRKEWIYTKLTELETAAMNQKINNLGQGDSILILGRPCRIELVLDTNKKKAKAVLDGETIIVRTPEISKTMIREAIVAYLKEFTRFEVYSRIDKYTEKLEVQYNRIAIKDQKRRWGSCSHLGNLNFNWRCGMMPEFVLEYILAHEVRHLVYLNHSQSYWKLLHSVSPHDGEARAWLKENGGLLNI